MHLNLNLNFTDSNNLKKPIKDDRLYIVGELSWTFLGSESHQPYLWFDKDTNVRI